MLEEGFFVDGAWCGAGNVGVERICVRDGEENMFMEWNWVKMEIM